jgi:hypothetical protein
MDAAETATGAGAVAEAVRVAVAAAVPEAVPEVVVATEGGNVSFQLLVSRF